MAPRFQSYRCQSWCEARHIRILSRGGSRSGVGGKWPFYIAHRRVFPGRVEPFPGLSGGVSTFFQYREVSGKTLENFSGSLGRTTAVEIRLRSACERLMGRV